ncbi:MAG TPA: c-type cytochrome [Mucilaginibacter sp.]
MKIIKLITPALCVVLALSVCTASGQAKKKVVAKKKPATTVAKAPPPPPFATDAEIADGKDLILKSDCLTCHKIEDKLVGPAYTAIAAKYPQNKNSLDTLAKKVITGGKGVWGPIPMAPHPNISQVDANKMIKYILTLNAKNPATSTK